MSPERRPTPGDRPEQPSTTRLVGTLGLVAVLAGLGIVSVHGWAQPRIEAHRAEALRQAVMEVLGAPDRYETLYVTGDRLTAELPAGADSSDAIPVYAGYDAAGSRIGFAVPAEKTGYQDVIRLIFGYDPGRGEVLGMKVLESKETPGLGAKIITDSSFVREFRGVETPLEGVKEGGDAPGEVDMITGATISSETVIEAINERLEELGPVLRAGEVAAAGTGGGAP